MVRFSWARELREGEVSGMAMTGEGVDLGLSLGAGIGVGFSGSGSVFGSGFVWGLGGVGGLSESCVFLMLGLFSLQIRMDSAVASALGGVTLSLSLMQR